MALKATLVGETSSPHSYGPPSEECDKGSSLRSHRSAAFVVPFLRRPRLHLVARWRTRCPRAHLRPRCSRRRALAVPSIAMGGAGARSYLRSACAGLARSLLSVLARSPPPLHLAAHGVVGYDVSAPPVRLKAIVFNVARRRRQGRLPSLLGPFRGLNSDYRLTTVTHNRTKERKRLGANLRP